MKKFLPQVVRLLMFAAPFAAAGGAAGGWSGAVVLSAGALAATVLVGAGCYAALRAQYQR